MCHIPLCNILAMPMVTPTLPNDLAKLEQEFVHGYREGTSNFYVTIIDGESKPHEDTEARMTSWVPIWSTKNEEFNYFLLSVLKLVSFKNLIFL